MGVVWSLRSKPVAELWHDDTMTPPTYVKSRESLQVQKICESGWRHPRNRVEVQKDLLPRIHPSTVSQVPALFQVLPVKRGWDHLHKFSLVCG